VSFRTVGLDFRERPVGIEVAGARAVLKLSDRVVHRHRLLRLDVLLRPKHCRVTGGAVGFEGRKFSGNQLRIADVTCAAIYCCAMAGIVCRQMTVADRRPAHGAMAGVA